MKGKFVMAYYGHIEEANVNFRKEDKRFLGKFIDEDKVKIIKTYTWHCYVKENQVISFSRLIEHTTLYNIITIDEAMAEMI